jgi:hypothetical protein
MRGADEPGPGMVGFDFVHDDAPVTQFTESVLFTTTAAGAVLSM